MDKNLEYIYQMAEERLKSPEVVENSGIQQENGKLIDLTEGCLTGSPQHKANIRKVQEERPDDFIFYTDYLGEWRFKELVDSLAEDNNLDRRQVENHIFDNLERLCSFDVPSMYSVVRRRLAPNEMDRWEDELIESIDKQIKNYNKHEALQQADIESEEEMEL